MWSTHSVRSIGKEYADYKTASYAAKRAEETLNVDSEQEARPLKRPGRFEETGAGSSGESDPETEDDHEDQVDRNKWRRTSRIVSRSNKK